jgi:hypothetical protein
MMSESCSLNPPRMIPRDVRAEIDVGIFAVAKRGGENHAGEEDRE